RNGEAEVEGGRALNFRRASGGPTVLDPEPVSPGRAGPDTAPSGRPGRRRLRGGGSGSHTATPTTFERRHSPLRPGPADRPGAAPADSDRLQPSPTRVAHVSASLTTTPPEVAIPAIPARRWPDSWARVLRGRRALVGWAAALPARARARRSAGAAVAWLLARPLRLASIPAAVLCLAFSVAGASGA